MNSTIRNWSDLRVFLAVMEHGSTLAASRMLGMSQPTVARRMDVLEHELSLKLFERDTRGFRPTDAARALLPSAKKVEAAVDEFSEAVELERVDRPIRITAHPANISGPVAELVTEYSSTCPDTSFQFIPTQAVLDLMAGEADIALRLSDFPEDDRLIRRKIGTVRFAVFGAKTYAARHGLPGAPEEMNGHAILTYDGKGSAKRNAEWMLRHATEPKEVRSFTEIDLYIAALKSGQGLGLGTLRQTAEDVLAGRLVRCFGPVDELDLDALMLISPQAHARPEVRKFTKFFATKMTETLR